MVKLSKLAARQFLLAGDVAPESGVYRVFHGEHRLAHEVTVLRGEPFPPCSKCDGAVHFELLRPVPVADDFPVVLNSLPVFEEEDENRKELAS